MDLNNADGCQPCGEVYSRFRADGVPIAGNSMKDIFPQSGGENKFVAEGFGNRTARFQQCFEMIFRGLLKSQGRFAAVAPMRVAAGQQRRFGNPNAVFVPPEIYFRQWNNHGNKLAHAGLSANHFTRAAQIV